MDPVTKYAHDIVSGNIKACDKIKKACQRHMNDLRKSKQDDYPYYFDINKAMDVIRFIEMMPNPENGQPLKLVNFQLWEVGSIFGWRCKDTGYRRFKKAVISQGRKQGKTILVAGIALYMLLYDPTPLFERQIYTAANTRDQAKLAFNFVKNFLNKLRNQSKYIKSKTKPLTNEIIIPSDSSFIKPLSSDYNSLDGLNALLAIVDEQSRSKDYGLIDVLETSQGQQKQPLLLIISTVSEMVNDWFHVIEYKYATEVLNGDVVNDTYFVAWYEMESDEELEDEDNWIKANPILYDDNIREVMLPNIRAKWKQAQDTNQTSLAKIKYFNMWQVSGEESYMTVADWDNARIKEKPDLIGRDVYIGMDLAKVGDLSAVSWIVPINEEGKFYVDSHAFVGTRGGIDNKAKRDKINYRRLEELGLVTFSNRDSGNISDQQILDFIDELRFKYNFNVVNICYDRYSASNIVETLENEGYTMVDVAQGFMTLSEPTKQFRKMVQDGDVVHDGNELLTMAVNNAITVEKNDAVMLDKKRNREKIDPLAAVIDGFTRAYLHDFSGSYLADNDYYMGEFHF